MDKHVAGLARDRYVKDNKSPITIATELNLDLIELRALIRSETWDALREQHQLDMAQKLMDEPMTLHTQLADQILRDIQVLRTALMDPDGSESASSLRSKVESLRSLAEAAAATIKVHREANGLKLGAASAQAKKQSDGVRYTVELPPGRVARVAADAR